MEGTGLEVLLADSNDTGWAIGITAVVTGLITTLIGAVIQLRNNKRDTERQVRKDTIDELQNLVERSTKENIRCEEDRHKKEVEIRRLSTENARLRERVDYLGEIIEQKLQIKLRPWAPDTGSGVHTPIPENKETGEK